MKSPVTIKIEGLRELEENLTQFSRATARGVMNRALKKAAAPIEQRALSTVAVDTGKLKKSIKTRVVRDRSAGKAAFAQAVQDGATRAEAGMAFKSAAVAAGEQTALVRIAATAPHAHLIEFGTKAAPALPFMGPALQAGREAAASSIKASLKTEIERTAKRIAARGNKRKSK